MSGKMGSGASHILEGIKRKQVEVKPEQDKHVEHHNVNVHNLNTDEQINVNVLQEAVDLALNKKQRISIWAPDIALIMWYLKLSTPMFSISDVAKKYIAEGLMRDYPELYKRANEELNKSR
jgi:uncharacterized membrane protein